MIQQLSDAINNTGVAEVIKISESATSVQIVHRVSIKQLSRWLDIVTFVLKHKNGWEEHVCKRYFLRDGKVRYAWNFIIQCAQEKKEDVVKQVAELFSKARHIPAPTALTGPLDSYPLAGVRDTRNTPQGPRDPRAPGPMMGGLSQKGAHRI